MPTSPDTPPPLDLPRLIMRRAAWVAGLVLLAALVTGLWRMADDIEDEVEAATSLAGVMARLGQLSALGQADDRAALAAVAELQSEHPLRHLLLSVRAADGRELLAPPQHPHDNAAWAWLLQVHSALSPAESAATVSWPVPRPDGRVWTVTLTASPDSERREAMASLLDMMVMLLSCVAGLLLVMRWNVRRALAPLGGLLASIAGIERNQTQAVQALPRMPIGELEALAAALRHLGAALDQAEAQRRVLSRQVLSLQEDERARLARELHDEFGQRLTAMRVDAAWLTRRLAAAQTAQAAHPDAPGVVPATADPRTLEVVQGLAEQCRLIQQDVRQVLVRLNPLGQADGYAAEGEPPERLAELLQQLVATWQGGSTGQGLRLRLQLDWQADELAAPQPWPEDGAQGPQTTATPRADAPRLPRALALTLYRISQEALTNVARHAQAREALLSLRLVGPWRAAADWRIDWAVADDGQGLPSSHPAALRRGALAGAAVEGDAGDAVAETLASAVADVPDPALMGRGNGLAGLRERVWSQGTDLHLGPGLHGRGLRLAARLSTRTLADPLQPGAFSSGGGGHA